MSQAKTVKQVLQAVEWMLVHVGWTQGCDYRDDQNMMIMEIPTPIERVRSMCVSGAFNLVKTTDQLRSQAFTSLVKELQNSNQCTYVIAFNDSSGRTKEEVLSVVRKAIKKAK